MRMVILALAFAFGLTACPTPFAIAECRDSCERGSGGGFMFGYSNGSCVCGPLPDAVLDQMLKQLLDGGAR